jgi:hypothetical protein
MVVAGGMQTTTDVNGFFSFPKVSKGDYAVAAKASDSLGGLVRVNVIGGDTAHAVISLDLLIYPMLTKYWVLGGIIADTGAIGHPFDTVFTPDASPEILHLDPMGSTYTYYRHLIECTELGEGTLTAMATTLRFDTGAACAFRFNGPYDTLVIESSWKVNGRDVPAARVYCLLRGPLPPLAWPQTLCQFMNHTGPDIRLLKGKAMEADGAAVIGQVIQIVSTWTSMPSPVTTDSGGNFRFYVLPGMYTLKTSWGYPLGNSPPPLTAFTGTRPDIANDTQVIAPVTPDSVGFVYLMYPKDTVISGTIVDTIGPVSGVSPTFPLWVELATSDSVCTRAPNQAPVSPVSDTISGTGDFTIRVSSHFPWYRLCWGNYRPKIPVSSNPGLALGLTVSYSGGIAPGTAGIRLTVIRLN